MYVFQFYADRFTMWNCKTFFEFDVVRKYSLLSITFSVDCSVCQTMPRIKDPNTVGYHRFLQMRVFKCELVTHSHIIIGCYRNSQRIDSLSSFCKICNWFLLCIYYSFLSKLYFATASIPKLTFLNNIVGYEEINYLTCVGEISCKIISWHLRA